MPNTEEEQNVRDSITADVESDEAVRLDISGVAILRWEEDPAPGRPEMTGQWYVDFRDGTSSEAIDLPQKDVDGAIAVAKDLVVKKLTGR